MKTYGEIDSKFRFVIVASKRAKQLLRGVKPKVKSKSKNPIRVAQVEVRQGLVDYEIIELKKEEVPKPEDESFIGEEIRTEEEETGEEETEEARGKDEKSEIKPKKKAKGEPKRKRKKTKT